jgi:hypothetical protein
MKTSTKLSAFFVGLLMLLAALSPALALPSLITAPQMSIASINGSSTSVKSTNWSGYVETGSSVTSASGTWAVPATSSPVPTSSTTYYAAFWVGIDGYSSSTVEQTGILAESTGATTTYLAWFEFYPGPMYEITQTTTVNHKTTTTPAPVAPNDIISASVTYSSSSATTFGSPSNLVGSPSATTLGNPSNLFSSPSNAFINTPAPIGRSTSKFTITITDESTTHGWTYSTSESVPNAARTSAEWIVETPTVSNGRTSSLAPLADFGTTIFSSSTAAATSLSTPISITMVTDNTAKQTMAAPTTSFSSAGFSVAWDSAGP